MSASNNKNKRARIEEPPSSTQDFSVKAPIELATSYLNKHLATLHPQIKTLTESLLQTHLDLLIKAENKIQQSNKMK